jgi:hypothetical protein
VSDAKTSYVSTATIVLTATDNFKGSGVDSLYYRVDGGSFVQVVSLASKTAAKLFVARLATAPAALVTIASAVDPSVPVPADHPVGAKTPDQCVLCHTITIPTPEPTSTPEPTGTPAPDGGLTKTVTVTGVGEHTIEYWAQDTARNASVRVTKTFTIAAPAVVGGAKKRTSTTLRYSATTITHGHYVTLTAHVKGGTFAPGSVVRFEVKRPGSLSYVGLKVVRVNADGIATYRYKVNARGNNWHRVRFFGNATYLPAPIQVGLKLHVN